jgi:hypothetical protein
MSNQIEVKSEQNDEQTKSDKKANRHKIRQQLEFYFSDSNLSKDRFLKQEIASNSDGYLKANTFLKFNKIRLLTTDLKEIVKSAKKVKLSRTKCRLDNDQAQDFLCRD